MTRILKRVKNDSEGLSRPFDNINTVPPPHNNLLTCYSLIKQTYTITTRQFWHNLKMQAQNIVAILILSFNLFAIHTSDAVGFGEPCNQTHNDCDSYRYLQCGFLSETCECMNTLNTWYDPADEVCKLLVGVDCVRNFPFSQDCVKNAICPDAPNPKCTCESQYEENVERQCFLGYDSLCTVADSVPGDMDRCDPAGFLKVLTISDNYVIKMTEI